VKVRGAYFLMAPSAWFVLVPLAHASLLSGIVLWLVIIDAHRPGER